VQRFDYNFSCEAVEAGLNALSGVCLTGLGKTTEMLREGSPNRDLNQASLEHKSVALLFSTRYSFY
jgi:hypothetical protein